MNDKIRELSLNAANEVADQFASGYFNDEMVYNVADIIAKNYESVVRECMDNLEWHGLDRAVSQLNWFLHNKVKG